MATGIISNIQRASIHDGPGMRTTVFFKGCPLRCLWCHNPETYAFGRELRLKREACIHCLSCVQACPSGALTVSGDTLRPDRDSCVRCFSCADACPSGALAVSGREMTADEILTEALADRSMYARTGGGVTLSGGEPTAQFEICLELLTALRSEGIHTCLDTSGQCDPMRFARLASSASMVLFDLKHPDPDRHAALTGTNNRLILANFALLGKLGVPVEVRIPVIPGMNDDEQTMRTFSGLISGNRAVQSVILLGYHKLGQSKIYNFDEHGHDIGVVPPKQAHLEALADIIRSTAALPVQCR